MKPDGFKFSIYRVGEADLSEVAKNFDGCPLKDNDGNIIGKVISVIYDGEKMVCEAKLD